MSTYKPLICIKVIFWKGRSCGPRITFPKIPYLHLRLHVLLLLLWSLLLNLFQGLLLLHFAFRYWSSTFKLLGLLLTLLSLSLQISSSQGFNSMGEELPSWLPQGVLAISLLDHLHLYEHLKCNMSKSNLIKSAQAFPSLENGYHHAGERAMLEASESSFTPSFLFHPRSIHWQDLLTLFSKHVLDPTTSFLLLCLYHSRGYTILHLPSHVAHLYLLLPLRAFKAILFDHVIQSQSLSH